MSLMLRCTWIVKASTKRILVVSLIELVKRLVTRSNGVFDGFDSSRLWTCFQCFQPRPRFDTFCWRFSISCGERVATRHGRGDSWASRGDYRDACCCAELLIGKILWGFSQSSKSWWFGEVGAWFRMILIPFHHSILWAFVLWISAWFRFHLETREDHIIAWIVRFRSWGKTNMYITYTHTYIYIHIYSICIIYYMLYIYDIIIYMLGCDML